MGSRYNEYGQACRRAYQAILREVRDRLPNVPEDKVKAAALCLLAEGSYLKCTEHSLGLTSVRRQVGSLDQVRWELARGAWFWQDDDPTKLDHLDAVFQQLSASLPCNAELSALAEAKEQVEKAIAEFRAGLTPNPLLRQMVMNGRCDWYP